MKNIKAKAEDLLDKVSSPTTRSGHVTERVSKMINAGVSKKVIATQMSENSPNSTKYTERDVETLAKVHKDCETKVVITSKQANALINDQKEVDSLPLNIQPKLS